MAFAPNSECFINELVVYFANANWL